MKVKAEIDGCSWDISLGRETDDMYFTKWIEMTEEEYEIYLKYENLRRELFKRYDAATHIHKV